MDNNIEIKGNNKQIDDSQYETILKYAKLIEEETKLKVCLTNFFVTYKNING